MPSFTILADAKIPRSTMISELIKAKLLRRCGLCSGELFQNRLWESNAQEYFPSLFLDELWEDQGKKTAVCLLALVWTRSRDWKAAELGGSWDEV
jgi:hypothetical protein